jgi:hypothetical protein
MQLIAERDREVDAIKGYYLKRFIIDYFWKKSRSCGVY